MCIFFSKRTGDQYTTQVIDAIDNFYHVDGMYAHATEYHSVEFILASVKHEMGHTPLDPNDNLAKILEVLREKTTIDYASLNSDIMLRRYDDDRNDVFSPSLVIEQSSTVSSQRNNLTPSLTR